MKIVIAGASGFIGKYISQQFLLQGDDVVHISRLSITNNWTPEHLLTTINGADVLINLAGKNINCRLNKKNKEEQQIKKEEVILQKTNWLQKMKNKWGI